MECRDTTIYEDLAINISVPYSIISQPGGKICVFDLQGFDFYRCCVGMLTVSSPYLGAIAHSLSDSPTPAVDVPIYGDNYMTAFVSGAPRYKMSSEIPVTHRYLYISLSSSSNYSEGCFAWALAYNKKEV